MALVLRCVSGELPRQTKAQRLGLCLLKVTYGYYSIAHGRPATGNPSKIGAQAFLPLPPGTVFRRQSGRKKIGKMDKMIKKQRKKQPGASGKARMNHRIAKDLQSARNALLFQINAI